MDFNSLDFQQARIKQVLFKSQLRSILYGVKEADDSFFTVRNNPLGIWLFNVAQPQYGHFPEVREIQHQLSGMLRVAQDLVSQYRRGKIEESRAGLDQIDTFNNKISSLLLTLEAKVKQL